MRVDIWDVAKAKAAPPIDAGFPRGFNDVFELGEEIGRGGFGIVRLVTERSSRQVYACKSIKKRLDVPNPTPEKQSQYLDRVLREIRVLVRLRGTLSVVAFRGAWEDDESVHVVMEYCRGGDLASRVGRGDLDEARVAGWMRQVLQTLAQCHAHRILHRDIKAGNFLLLTPEPDSVIKAVDFGLADFFQVEEDTDDEAGEGEDMGGILPRTAQAKGSSGYGRRDAQQAPRDAQRAAQPQPTPQASQPTHRPGSASPGPAPSAVSPASAAPASTGALSAETALAVEAQGASPATETQLPPPLTDRGITEAIEEADGARADAERREAGWAAEESPRALAAADCGIAPLGEAPQTPKGGTAAEVAAATAAAAVEAARGGRAAFGGGGGPGGDSPSRFPPPSSSNAFAASAPAASSAAPAPNAPSSSAAPAPNAPSSSAVPAPNAPSSSAPTAPAAPAPGPSSAGAAPAAASSASSSASPLRRRRRKLRAVPRTDLGLEGTAWFMAPEVLSSMVLPASDVWSAGVLAYQLLSGRLPFDDRSNPDAPALSRIWRSILGDEPRFRGSAWAGVSPEAVAFVRALLNKDWKKRPTALEALRHPWLAAYATKIPTKDRRPLHASVVARMQRYSQAPVLQRSILELIASEILRRAPPNLSPDASVRAGGGALARLQAGDGRGEGSGRGRGRDGEGSGRGRGRDGEGSGRGRGRDGEGSGRGRDRDGEGSGSGRGRDRDGEGSGSGRGRDRGVALGPSRGVTFASTLETLVPSTEPVNAPLMAAPSDENGQEETLGPETAPARAPAPAPIPASAAPAASLPGNEEEGPAGSSAQAPAEEPPSPLYAARHLSPAAFSAMQPVPRLPRVRTSPRPSRPSSGLDVGGAKDAEEAPKGDAGQPADAPGAQERIEGGFETPKNSSEDESTPDGAAGAPASSSRRPRDASVDSGSPPSAGRAPDHRIWAPRPHEGQELARQLARRSHSVHGGRLFLRSPSIRQLGLLSLGAARAAEGGAPWGPLGAEAGAPGARPAEGAADAVQPGVSDPASLPPFRDANSREGRGDHAAEGEESEGGAGGSVPASTAASVPSLIPGPPRRRPRPGPDGSPSASPPGAAGLGSALSSGPGTGTGGSGSAGLPSPVLKAGSAPTGSLSLAAARDRGARPARGAHASVTFAGIGEDDQWDDREGAEGPWKGPAGIAARPEGRGAEAPRDGDGIPGAEAPRGGDGAEASTAAGADSVTAASGGPAASAAAAATAGADGSSAAAAGPSRRHPATVGTGRRHTAEDLPPPDAAARARGAEYWRLLRAASELALMDSRRGRVAMQGYVHTAPRNEHERRQQQLAARLALDTSRVEVDPYVPPEELELRRARAAALRGYRSMGNLSSAGARRNAGREGAGPPADAAQPMEHAATAAPGGVALRAPKSAAHATEASPRGQPLAMGTPAASAPAATPAAPSPQSHLPELRAPQPKMPKVLLRADERAADPAYLEPSPHRPPLAAGPAGLAPAVEEGETRSRGGNAALAMLGQLGQATPGAAAGTSPTTSPTASLPGAPLSTSSAPLAAPARPTDAFAASALSSRRNSPFTFDVPSSPRAPSAAGLGGSAHGGRAGLFAGRGPSDSDGSSGGASGQGGSQRGFAPPEWKQADRGDGGDGDGGADGGGSGALAPAPPSITLSFLPPAPVAPPVFASPALSSPPTSGTSLPPPDDSLRGPPSAPLAILMPIGRQASVRDETRLTSVGSWPPHLPDSASSDGLERAAVGGAAIGVSRQNSVGGSTHSGASYAGLSPRGSSRGAVASVAQRSGSFGSAGGSGRALGLAAAALEGSGRGLGAASAAATGGSGRGIGAASAAATGGSGRGIGSAAATMGGSGRGLGGLGGGVGSSGVLSARGGASVGTLESVEGGVQGPGQDRAVVSSERQRVSGGYARPPLSPRSRASTTAAPSPPPSPPPQEPVHVPFGWKGLPGQTIPGLFAPKPAQKGPAAGRAAESREGGGEARSAAAGGGAERGDGGGNVGGDAHAAGVSASASSTRAHSATGQSSSAPTASRASAPSPSPPAPPSPPRSSLPPPPPPSHAPLAAPFARTSPPSSGVFHSGSSLSFDGAARVPSFEGDPKRLSAASLASFSGLQSERSQLMPDVVTMPEDLARVMRRLRFREGQALTSEELADGLRRLGYMLEPAEVEMLVAIADADTSGEIRESEFVASQIDWNVLQRNNKDLFLDCARAAFEGLGPSAGGGIPVDRLIDLLRQKLPEAEIDYAVEDGLLQSGYVDAEDVDFEGFLKLLHTTDDREQLMRLEQYDARVRAAEGSGKGESHAQQALDSLDGKGGGERKP